MPIIRKKETKIQIIITDDNGAGLWKIETKGQPEIGDVCDALLAAYCGAAAILVDNTEMTADLVKQISMSELEKHLNKEEDETPCAEITS